MILTEYVVVKNKVVKVDDLKDGSHERVDVQCPLCGDIRNTMYKQIIKNGHCLCKKCKHVSLRSVINSDIKFGYWTTISSSSTVGMTLCVCKCGTVRDVDNYSLIYGKSTSCGCYDGYRKDRIFRVKIGESYNKLTVVGIVDDFTCECVCLCGNHKIIKNIVLISGRTKSCGCSQKEKVKVHIKKLNKAQTKENHPMWKGGISGERQLSMQSIEYKTFRNDVFKRDRWRCIRCGHTGSGLNAHHILPYAEYKELRTDVNNGITFCKDCHTEFHKIYGRKNIGQLQIDEYLKLQ